MAEADAAYLEPEYKIAREFSRVHALSVPVDIEGIVSKFADIESAAIPFNVDALVIRKDLRRSGNRPLVLVANRFTTRHNRYRFTLAHELGHMIIPWQPGTMFCHASITYRADDELFQQIETEANRFASELLVPYEWASNFLSCQSGTLAERVAAIAETAKVSPEVAVIAAARACHPETALLLLDSSETVTLSVASPNSTFRRPLQGAVLDHDSFDEWGVVSSVRIGYGRSIVSLDYAAAHLSEMTSDVTGDLSTEILSAILVDAEPVDAKKRKRLLNTVNGIIGYGHDIALKSGIGDAHGILLKIRQRFVARTDVNPVTRHDRFQSFLEAKARELAKKR
jgi:hypothetical protein